MTDLVAEQAVLVGETQQTVLYISSDIKIRCVLMLLLFTIGLPATSSSNQQKQAIRGDALAGFPHVQGTHLIDGNNQPLLLHGAMMESSFAYLNEWNAGVDPTKTLNTQTFTAMRAWGMNALRINISQWIEQADKTGSYRQKLQQVVTQATQAGLYIIIDFHDDVQSGATGMYADGMLHMTSLTWWKSIAKDFRNNPQVMFDLINEPLYPDWCSWLYGGNAQGKCSSSITNHDIAGFVNVIQAIRSAGAQQIIVVEPGKAGGSNPQDAGWVNFDPTKITDPTILYSKHEYQNVISGDPTSWNRTWGVLLGHYPLYYGEWAVLANPADPAHCQGLTSENADHITSTFLHYLRSLDASWTYWDFEPYHLVTDFTSYTPTSFQTATPWTCPNATYAGAGLDIRQFLLGQLRATETATSFAPTSPTPILSQADVAGGRSPSSCGAWSIVASPNAIYSDYLTGVAAVASNDVWTVGYYNTKNMDPKVIIEQLIEHWNGRTWSIVRPPETGASFSFLEGVKAIAANNVWAIGSYLPSGSPSRTLIEHWNGATWSVIPSPNIASRDDYLNGIAAISPNDIWVVGYASDSSGGSQTLLEHWNGTNWSLIPGLNGGSGNTYMNDVAAISANDVWAVGSFYPSGSNASQTLIEHWNGTQWGLATSPNDGTLGSFLDGVTVVSANNVWVSGSFIRSGTPDNFSQSLIEHWNGLNWSVISSPNVGSNWNLLRGVTAISANDVWAVGDDQQVIGSKTAYVSLSEQWNGSQWSVVTSQNAGSLYTYPNAVAYVPGTNQLWMVGNVANISGPSSTLTEFYCK